MQAAEAVRIPLKSQRGFSLIELMTALVLGLFMVSVAAGVFLSSNRNFRQDEAIARMQENARHALRVMSRDLTMIGFWGPLVDTVSINSQVRDCTAGDDAGNPVACGGFFSNSVLTANLSADCGPGTTATAPSHWMYDVKSSVQIINEASADTASSTFNCINGSDFVDGTDVLAIKRLKGQALAADRAASDDNGDVFLRTNGDSGMLFRYQSSVAAPADAEDWRYQVNVYYIQDHFLDQSDAIPTLYRKTLDGNGMATETGGVAQGIEYFHVTFGIDAGNDGVPDFYVAQPTTAEMRAAVTARLYVLARSLTQDHQYNNNKVYTMGSVVRDYSNAPDHYYRRVFTTTVQLRNQVHRTRLRTES
jgi:type IV pilus assembly protein PilW